MDPNPFLGVFFHALGGLASGSFYVPYRGVKKWSWETYWLVGGFFSWIICPWVIALLTCPDVMGVLRQQTMGTLELTYLFGILWGFGGLTFGLTMRYLGMSLGMGVALGYCAALGTLLPPALKIVVPLPDNLVPDTLVQIAQTPGGRITLAGVGVCLLGIGVAALAGFTKEKEMPEAEKKKAISEFSFTKGLMVATFSGVMSACFSFGFTAGKPINEAALRVGTPILWSGFPRLIVILLGGFTTNFIWCVFLNLKNKSGGQYLASRERTEPAAAKVASPAVPLFANYLFSALAGTLWYLQFFFYSMGETQMGRYSFASWTLHMSWIIVFSTMWGWILHEWKGSSRKVHLLIAGGIGTLILSTFVVGWGTYVNTKP